MLKNEFATSFNYSQNIQENVFQLEHVAWKLSGALRWITRTHSPNGQGQVATIGLVLFCKQNLTGTAVLGCSGDMEMLQYKPQNTEGELQGIKELGVRDKAEDHLITFNPAPCLWEPWKVVTSDGKKVLVLNQSERRVVFHYIKTNSLLQ